jgi:hypothetical protein
MRIDSEGRVGIGTASPERALVVSDAGAEGFEFYPGSSDTGNTLNHYDRVSMSYIDITTNADQHIFARADGEKARIDSDGRLLVGTSTYAESTTAAFKGGYGNAANPGRIALLRQYSTISGNNLNAELARIIFADDNGDGDGAQIRAVIDGTSWSTTSKPTRLEFFTTADGASSPTERMRIDSNGDMKIGGTLPASPKISLNADGSATFAGNITAANVSDVRFKTNIQPASPQLADVVALGNQLKNWDWNDEAPLNDELKARRFLGLVAQEAEKVCPELTYTVGEGDDSYKAINHDILVMKLLGAVAELQAKVATLEAS